MFITPVVVLTFIICMVENSANYIKIQEKSLRPQDRVEKQIGSKVKRYSGDYDYLQIIVANASADASAASGFFL